MQVCVFFSLVVHWFTSPHTSSYLVAVHNKRTNTTTFRPAPLHVMTQQVKALKNLAPIEVTNEERMLQRNKLGEAFGTKKAKAGESQKKGK